MKYLLMCCLVACGGKGGAGAGAKPTGPAAAAGTVSASFACTDPGVNGPPTSWSTSISASKLERCIFHGADGSLDVAYEVGQEGAVGTFSLNFTHFTGAGTYTAPQVSVSVTGAGGQGGAPSTSIGAGPQAQNGEGDTCKSSCTVKVSDAKVTSVQAGATGTLALEVDCPKLTTAGEGCVTCNASPTTIAHINVADCKREE